MLTNRDDETIVCRKDCLLDILAFEETSDYVANLNFNPHTWVWKIKDNFIFEYLNRISVLGPLISGTC